MIWAFLLAGCASAPSGKIAGVAMPPDATVAIFSTPNYPYDGFDVTGNFLDTLRKYGLTPTSRADSTFVLQIGFREVEGLPVVCSLVLQRDGKPVVSAGGTGRVVANARPDTASAGDRAAAARASAFQAAVRDFEAKARGPS